MRLLNKGYIFLILLMLSTACSSLMSSKPAGTLSEERMADILVDIHITEATLRVFNDSISRLSDTSALRMRFAEVFRKHDVTPDEFNISLNYYIEHIEILDNIYTDVINRLSEQELQLTPKNTGPSKPAKRALTAADKNNAWLKSLLKPEPNPHIYYFDTIQYPVVHP